MAAAAASLSVKHAPYGKHPSGAEITLWTLSNDAPGGIEVQAIDYGAILVSVLVPDAAGVRKNVVLGYDHLEAWVSGKPWFNSIVGRHANRIKGGLFSIDGESYQLERNNHENNLHSGATGYNSKVMSSKEIRGTDDTLGKFVGVEMSFDSPDGEGGFPGSLAVVTSFRLFGDNTLQMDFRAALSKPDENKPTIVSLCNHAYWNLNGSDGRKDVLEHTLRVNGDSITELDGGETMLTTGRILPVADGPYDFRTAHTIGGPKLEELDKQLPAPAGYDINYVLNKDHRVDQGHEASRSVELDGVDLRMSFAARLHDPSSGRTMDVYTSAPGIQVYSGNFLDGESLVGREGVAYPKHAAVCLETQLFPDAINHAEEWKNYPSPILRPGQKYAHCVQHKFSVLNKQ